MAAGTQLLLRIDPEVWADVEKWASDELRSVNAQIEYLLREAVRKRRGGRADYAARAALHARRLSRARKLVRPPRHRLAPREAFGLAALPFAALAFALAAFALATFAGGAGAVASGAAGSSSAALMRPSWIASMKRP